MTGSITKALSVAACLLFVSVLPVVPIQSAPVVPHPSYTLHFVSLLILFSPLIGVSYRATWYTLVSLLVLITAAVIAGIRLANVLTGTKRKHSA